MSFLQKPYSGANPSSIKPKHSLDSGLCSKRQPPASISPPPDNAGFDSLPSKLTDGSQLPSSPESYQASPKLKLSPAVEVQAGQSCRNLRPRLDLTKSSCQCEDASEKVRMSPVLSPRSNTCSTEDIHANWWVSPSGESPHKPSRERWSTWFSCHSVLSDLSFSAKVEIETFCNEILRSDFAEFMEKHLPTWLSIGFWHSPSFEAVQPQNDNSKAWGQSIWRYVKAISAEEETYYLKSRLEHIRLYLEYVEELDRQKKAGHPGQTAKIRAIDILCGTASLPKAAAIKTRQRFHQHKLIGERWWWSGCFLGHGFFVVCSEKTGKKVQNKAFSLDAFICYILSNRTDLLAFSSKFDHMADSLLNRGKVSVNLSKNEIQQWIHEAKASRPSTIRWEPWNTSAVASKATEFLLARSMRSCNSLPH